MLAAALDIASWILIVVGGAFGIIAGIGVLRMPDFFSRIHPAGMTDSMFAPCVLLALMLQSGWSIITVKLAFILLFLFLTSPTASHALAKAALHGGLVPEADEAD
jgi:multicomponent Na+:H+ antiporter subunit G